MTDTRAAAMLRHPAGKRRGARTVRILRLPPVPSLAYVIYRGGIAHAVAEVRSDLDGVYGFVTWCGRPQSRQEAERMAWSAIGCAQCEQAHPTV